MERKIDTKQLTSLASQLSAPTLLLDKLTLCDHKPESFGHFIELLPENSPAESGKLLYKLLRELEVLNISPSEKLVLLNKVRPITISCATKLARTTLSAQTAKAVSLSHALLKRMASGFRWVAKELSNSPVSSLPIPLLTQSVAHAIEAQGLIYLKSAQFHLGIHKQFWRDLHSLYRIAQICSLTSAPNPGRERGSNPSPSIHNEYLRILLLAAINPSQFSSADLNTTYEALKTWADETDIVSGQGRGLFVIDAQSDTGPTYNSKVDGSKRSHYKLHIDPLVASLRKRLADFPTATIIEGVAPRLIRELCAAWTEESLRQEDRIPNQDQTQLIYGLAFIHGTLTGEHNFDDYLDRVGSLAQGKKKKQEDASNTVEFSRADIYKKDIWHGADKGESGLSFPIDQESLNAPDAVIADTPDDSGYRVSAPLPAVILNNSDNGCCIELNQKAPPKIAPGELIATNNNDEWRIGVVRWKRTTSTLSILFGIEYFSGTATPCAVRVMRDQQASSPYLPGLRLNGCDDGNQQLLVPVMPFKHSDKVHLLGEAGQLMQLTSPLDTTGFVSRFVIQSLRAAGT